MRVTRYLSIFVALLLCGCSSIQGVLSADPAPPAGFIKEPEKLAPWPERAAFLQRIWFADRDKLYATRSRFKKILFKPTRTDFLLKPGWWTQLNTIDQAGYRSDVEEFARYVDASLRRAVERDPNQRFVIAPQPDAETVVYEFAITELVATKVHVNLAGTALGAVVPGGGLVKSTAKGSVAVEVAAYDGGNNELLLTWADRKVDQGSLFSFKDFSQLGHQRKAADSWATSLIEVWNTPASHKVEGLSPFTLSPF